jgi:hypothetical protein
LEARRSLGRGKTFFKTGNKGTRWEKGLNSILKYEEKFIGNMPMIESALERQGKLMRD